MTGLASLDAFAVASVLFKASGYGAALLAMGGVLFVVAFAVRADPATLTFARRIAVAAALIGLAVLAARFGLRAARISGMRWDGAIDPTMLGVVWQSPLGTAALFRGLGEGAILAILIPGVGRVIALGGAVLVALSYTQIGHTLGDPRWLLGTLLTVHLVAVAFWVGALAPLHRVAATPAGAPLLHAFGIAATGAVGLLAVAGVGLAWFLTGSLSGLFGTAYGIGLLAKVALVTGLLGLAALNKWRLVPDLRQGTPGAAAKLRRSIMIEGVGVIVILVLTAAITTVTTPSGG
ncbi:copper resistance D family protein [Jannaschia donghaensis]|uniref:copper resistance D family protein n=1 Tax=Jannaschia donghaensis TaxID=420998 RepID=UPI0006D7BE96|nr:CopD family protein [Jannaschia donghaensis]